jgi:hypothetical protein
MRTIRRLYFYLVAIISLEVVLWGVIGLLRSIISSAVVDMANALAQALALVLVGVPIFLFHWLWTQRAVLQDEEEQTASLRAIFFYAVLLATLIPVTQNLLALINRWILGIVNINTSRAILGGYQIWQDNIIAIGINAVAASYFWKVLKNNWKSLSFLENFTDVRRLYRFLWLLYSLMMVIFGAQQTIRYIFYLPVPENVLGEIGRELFANGFTLLLVGTPLWFYTWRICQKAIASPVERESNLRLGVLYLLALGGVITVLSAGGTLFDLLLRWVLGESLRSYEFINQAGGPISLGLPFAGVWAYFHKWLEEQIQSDSDEPRRTGKRRFYYYLLSVLGLAATFIGIAVLLSFVVDISTSSALWGDRLRSRLAGGIATLTVGLPLWLYTWRPMQAQALSVGEKGDRSRGSTLRKFYLYLAMFAGVIGGMVSAVWLMYTVINALLARELIPDFFSSLLNAAQLLGLFAILLIYHLRCLRQDGELAAQSVDTRQHEFPVVVIDPGNESYVKLITSMINKHAPSIPILVQSGRKKMTKETEQAKVAILPLSQVLSPPPTLGKWLKTFKGEKIVLEEAVSGWVISALTAEQVAQTVRRLADGGNAHREKPSAVWETIKTVSVIWLGIQVFFILLALTISLLAR